jgi:pimeloyl-ACP methyl ester carboxylesterase
MIEALRTPDARFADLPGYSFAPHYVVPQPETGLRMHYLDEGSRDPDAPVFLCFHGQPSWSYLYRKMIPVLGQAGRVVAPDLFGFGRSDKPVDDAVYTFDFYRDALLAFVAALDLRNVTLVCQDWGGLLGLTLPMEAPERFKRLIVMNTGLATGENPLGPGFEAWKAFNRSQPDMDLAALMKMASPILTEAEAAAYAAPFPDVTYKAGVRRFPELVPATPDAGGAAISRRARDWWRDEWAGTSFMAVGCKDPVISQAAMEGLRANISGCPEPMLVEDGGHFVQEWGEPIARAALARFGA